MAYEEKSQADVSAVDCTTSLSFEEMLVCWDRARSDWLPDFMSKFGIKGDNCDEIIQELGIRLLQLKERSFNRNGLVAWMKKVTYTLIVGTSRASKRRKELSYKDEDAPGSVPGVAEQLVRIEADAVHQNILDSLPELLQGLGSRQRRIIEGHYYQGISQRQIAGELGIHEGTVSREHVKILKALHTRLSEKFPDRIAETAITK